ncbi:hypothetical protein L873DRAFT_1819829, partial [Choiromyces venosus 120613-1]
MSKLHLARESQHHFKVAAVVLYRLHKHGKACTGEKWEIILSELMSILHPSQTFVLFFKIRPSERVNLLESV